MAEKDCGARIMAAAHKRFQHFGYGKTSMAEIAGDCDMSPGNLYRFFPGKLDIAEAIASDDFKAHLAHLRRLADKPGVSARQKLHDFLVEGLRRTYARFQKDPRAMELARLIAAERPGFADWMAQCER
jgi:AcrR family transcriptional regulator